MSTRERISAIIVKNKKLMLVTGYDNKYAWTPGGKPDQNESDLETLRREVKEELDVEILSARLYFSYEEKERDGKFLPSNERCYTVEYDGKPIPKKEITKILWYGRDDFINKEPKVIKNIVKHLMPKLIEDNYI